MLGNLGLLIKTTDELTISTGEIRTDGPCHNIDTVAGEVNENG
jgi:hypothetical protein